MSYYTLNYDEYFDTSFKSTRCLRNQANVLNLQISLNLQYSLTRPSKQSRREANSRVAYYTKQRDTLLNLYPEYFI